ncbi:MAG: YbbR-like domain-containing protein [Chloracidobacterium sp.]|nr:YbbR-like domain-containing protein [Chloracidobacterium sp.]
MATSSLQNNVIRKVFLEDLGLKLLALVITLALWLGVTGLSTPTTKRLTIPLNLSISSNAQVMNVPQQEVEIEISGDKRKIEQINRSELVASLDLTDLAPGDRVVSLSPDNVYVALPQGIKLVEVAPSRIAVNLEAVEEKEIEVKAETIGQPAAGFEVYDTAVLPQKIRVRGPASIVRILEYVQTDKIDLTGKTAEFTAKQIPVSAPNPKAAVLNTFVDVVFRIGEKRIERSFTIPVAGETGKTATFTLFAPKTLLQKLQAADLKAEMILNDRGELAPQVILPAELQDIAEIRKLTVK